MKHLLERFQKNMAAAAFAESGEWDAAREIIPAAKISPDPTWLDNIFAAITFAEKGLHNEARHFLKPARNFRTDFTPPVMEELGLKGVRLMYGTITI